jgi:hypothetical protein
LATFQQLSLHILVEPSKVLLLIIYLFLNNI